MSTLVLPVPLIPTLQTEQQSSAHGDMRYEDVAQDGRLSIHAMPQAIGWVWQDLMTKLPATAQLQQQGIIPVLSRLVIHAFEAPVRVDKPMYSNGGFYFAHSATGDRLYLNMVAHVQARGGRLVPPSGPDALCNAGHAFAEHTFTNLFAPAGKRGVTQLDVPGVPEPSMMYQSSPPQSLAEPLPVVASTDLVPASMLASWLAPRIVVPEPLIASLDHTDSNQHVNSLTYIRFFIDAVHRRIHQAILDGVAISKEPRLVRAVEISYRKPCFAGDIISASVGLFEMTQHADGHSPRLGAAGFLTRVGDDKPCAFVRVIMRS